MKEILKSAAGLISAVCIAGAIIVAGIWIITGGSYRVYQYFAPKYEQTRRETFEQSKAYNQGIQQELGNMMIEYQKADEEHKIGLKDVILHRVSDYDVNLLPMYQQEFVIKLRKGEL